jgi:peptide/nickel transport system substrate-binding protein
VTAPDEHTVVVTFASPECTALNYAGNLVPVPVQSMPADVADLMDADYNLNPSVTSGPFNFGEFRPGEQVSLVKSTTYKDALDGVVKPDGYIYKNVPDATVMVEQFLSGEINVIDNPLLARRNDIRATDAQVYNYPGNSWTYFAMNLADPTNPQNAFDDAGNPIDQGNHPFFGDVAVRQALARGIDTVSIATTSTQGEGTPMATFLIPASWALDESIQPIAYDPEAAAKLLTDAGWIDDDNDPSTPRVAQGAKFAPDGTKAEFTLYTNDSNPVRVAAGTLIQDELAQIGVKVDFQAIDFNTLLDIMDSQTFDAIILGWRNGYPDDPDATQLFTPQSDVIGSGSDFTSYNNPEFTDLNTQAKNVPGCDPEARKAIYSKMQTVFQQDLPYITLFAQNGMYAAAAGVSGFDPRPSNLLWNVDTWAVSTP